jgi:spore maturation protein CgeB
MIRQAIGGCKIALCLVRRANRDGHCMRTFEVAAMGACMLVEETDEHHDIFGEDGEAVVYFRTIADMLERTHWLLDRPNERNRLAAAVHSRITSGKNTYRHRLATMLGLGGE